MKNKLLVLTVLTLLWHGLLVVQSCGTCTPVTDKYFTIQGLMMENVRHFPRSERKAGEVLEPFQKIAMENLFIMVTFDHEWQYTFNHVPFASALATSCDDGYIGSQSVLKSITAISKFDFNEQIHKGDTLNSQLFYSPYPSHYTESKINADSLATYFNNTYDSLRIQPENSFFLLTRPTRSDTVSITFTYEFYTGEVYTATSPEVIIE